MVDGSKLVVINEGENRFVKDKIEARRLLAEEEIRESERKFRELYATVRDGIAAGDMEGNILECNQAYLDMVGYSAEEIRKKRYQDITPKKWHKMEAEVVANQVKVRGYSDLYEKEYIKKDGTVFPVSIRVWLKKDREGKPIGIWKIVRDITERKRAEEQTKRLREYLQLQINRMPIGLITWDREFRVKTWNPATTKIFGFTEEEALGKHPYDLIVPKEAQPHVDNIWRRLLEGDLTAHSLNENVTKDGRTIICDWANTPLKEADGTVIGVLSMVQDITERKQAEEALRRVNRAFRTLSTCNQKLVRAKDESDLLHEICRVIVQVGGYHLAWVGYAERNEEKAVRPVAHAGCKKGYLKTLNITWANTKRGHCPAGTAIRTGKPCILKNIPTNLDYVPWRAEAIKFGYASSIALPLIVNGRTFGALNIYAAEPDAFQTDEIELLAEMADDLAYGIMALRSRAKHKETIEELKRLIGKIKSREEVIPYPRTQESLPTPTRTESVRARSLKSHIPKPR
jgi:PAS domain S-box-containing protein